MRPALRVTLRATLLTLVALLVAPMATPMAQRVDPAETGLPVATSRIVADPAQYYDKLVTVSAGVDQILSKTVFLVDQQRAGGAGKTQGTGTPVLVVAQYLNAPVQQRTYLVVRGHLTTFEPASLARVAPEYTLDVTPDVAARYAGRPVIVANSVRDSMFAELGAKPAPPATSADAALTAAMQTIGPAMNGLRIGIRESEADVVAANAAKLLPAFAATEGVWTNLGLSRAMEWAKDARGRVLAVERDADAGDWEAALVSLGSLNQLCQNCHKEYRDQLENGTYRIKPDAK